MGGLRLLVLFLCGGTVCLYIAGHFFHSSGSQEFSLALRENVTQIGGTVTQGGSSETRVGAAGATVTQAPATVTRRSSTRESGCRPPPTTNLSSTNIQTYNFKWPGMPTGNSLFSYWDGRAIAACRGEHFRAINDPREKILRALPSRVNYSELPIEIAKRCKELRGQRSCPYPHLCDRAHWRLFYSGIFHDIQCAAEQIELHPLALDPLTVGIGIRCDDWILKHHWEYGLLRHSFFAEWIPKETKRVVIIGSENPAWTGSRKAVTVSDPLGPNAPKCLKAVWSLKVYLEKSFPGLIVHMGLNSSKGKEGDWAFFAIASRVILSPSTFHLTAAVGNPNTVVFPTIRRQRAQPLIPENGAGLSWRSPFGPNWNTPDAELLPGRTIDGMSWPDIRRWLTQTEFLP